MPGGASATTSDQAGAQPARRQGAKLLSAITILLLAACSPTVKVEAPDKPIVINLNVNISHEIRLKIDRDLDHLIENKEGLF